MAEIGHTKVSPGEKSLLTLPDSGSFIVYEKPLGPYKFVANRGKRYEIYDSRMILVSDATQDTYQSAGKMLRRVPTLYKDANGAIIQSAVTLRGEDATKLADSVIYPLTMIESGGNSSTHYWTPPRNQLESIQDAQKILRSGNILGVSGSYYIHVGAGPKMIAMKECKNCKTIAVYHVDVKNGERYELAPNGKIYVSDAYDEDVEKTRKILN